jgi:hypothetical protein
VAQQQSQARLTQKVRFDVAMDCLQRMVSAIADQTEAILDRSQFLASTRFEISNHFRQALFHAAKSNDSENKHEIARRSQRESNEWLIASSRTISKHLHLDQRQSD